MADTGTRALSEGQPEVKALDLKRTQMPSHVRSAPNGLDFEALKAFEAWVVTHVPAKEDRCPKSIRSTVTQYDSAYQDSAFTHKEGLVLAHKNTADEVMSSRVNSTIEK